MIWAIAASLTDNDETDRVARRHTEFFRDLFAPAAESPRVALDDLPSYIRDIDNCALRSTGRLRATMPTRACVSGKAPARCAPRSNLARLMTGQGRREDARDLLERVFAGFSEGQDTADLKRVEQLLAMLG